MSAHSNIISTTLEWSQEDAAKYFLAPLFISNNDLSHFDVITNISGKSILLDKYDSLKDITKANGGAGFAGSSVQSSNDNVTLTLDRLQVEHAQKAHAFYSHIKSQLMKQGVNRDDLTGTLLMTIISEMLMGGIMRDFSTILWWGSKTSGAAGATNKLADGIWEACKDATANTGVPSVTYSANATTGGAIVALNALMVARSAELAASEQVLFVSRAFADKYRAELTAKGVQGAYQDLQGGIANLSFNGIPMEVKPDWDVNIGVHGAALPAAGPSGTAKKECALLLAKNAIAIGTDFEVQDVDMWYNKDESENRFRMNYSFGCVLKDNKLAAKIKY